MRRVEESERRQDAREGVGVSGREDEALCVREGQFSSPRRDGEEKRTFPSPHLSPPIAPSSSRSLRYSTISPLKPMTLVVLIAA